MVRETRHLWVGNLPDNIREDRIREHFKRYGRVQSVKLLPRSVKEETSENTAACTVAFMDIKSASKAHTAEHKIDERTLTTEYYEPAAIPSAASPQNTNTTYSTSPGSNRFTNSHGNPEEHANFNERFYDRNNSRVAEGEYIRRVNYHDNRGRNRDRGYRNGPYNNVIDRHRSLNSSWSYDSSRTYNSETGYATTPTDTTDRRSSDSLSTKKKTKSRSGSRSVSPSGSTSSRSPTRSRSQSSSSSSSSTTSQASSSTSSPKSRRIAPSANSSHQPVVHSDDRRPLAICVRNLPLRSSDTSLKDGLFHEYKKHGKVTWVKIVGQGSERHAIVCFKKPDDVDKALEVSYDKLFFGCKIEVASYQGYDVDDNELRPYEAEIDEFHPKATRTLFIGNLEKDVTASDLRKHFDQFGEIIEIDIKKQGAVSSYAFCQYSDIISVVKAIRAMDGEHLGNNRIKLGFGKSMPTDCVWVDGIIDSVNEKYLTLQFDSFGPITQVIIDRDKGQGLIFYEQVLNAQAAVAKMRGVNMRGRKMQVDFASRECQEAFYEHLEKQGHPAERTNFEERNPATRTFEPTTITTTATRFARYELPSTRPRTASYSSRSSVAASQCNTASTVHSPSTPGSATPRGSGSRSRLARLNEYYDQNSEFSERRYRSYDEYSQGSAASHEEGYEHEYAAYNRESPSHLETADPRSVPHNSEHLPLAFAPPDIRNLQKERFHLLEQLEDYTSSGDELASSKKRIKLDIIEGPVVSDVVIETNREHRKVMEVRRTSDASLKHHSRRPSIDSKHSIREISGASYLPHSICKRRKTGGSDTSARIQHPDFSGSESIGSSRPGTPLCDERPENLPTEPRRIPREREGPLSLPLPRFASQILGKTGVSVAGIKGQKDVVLASPPPPATSPRISNHVIPSPAHVPPPASPPPRPPSISDSDSDAPPSPNFDELIQSLDEKYEKWSGSRAVSAAGSEALAKLDATASERFRFSYKLLDLDLKELQPSDIVKSVLAKPSVFDEDLKRLENVGGKFESGTLPKPIVTASLATAAVIPTVTPVIKTATITNPQLPKTPTMLSPIPSGSSIATAKSLQYPFPSHPPLQTVVSAPTTPTQSPLPTPPSSTTRSNQADSRQKSTSSTSTSSDSKVSKVSVNRTVSSGAVVSQMKINEPSNNKNGVSIPVNSSDVVQSTINSVDVNTEQTKGVQDCKLLDKFSDKLAIRRDSTNSNGSPRNEIKSRRNSENNLRKLDVCDKKSDNCDISANQTKLEEKSKNVNSEQRIENDRIESERIEKIRLEKERLEKENAEKDRIEKESLEKEKLEREKIEKERKERDERIRKEREEQERLEREKKERREREERERRERDERERREREDRERREREEKERREREDRERREREEIERREREEREKREREEKERREREDRDKREREEKERREQEEKEKREREERDKRDKEEQERVEKDRKRDDERKHKDENHEKRKDEHNSSRHREIHSDSKYKENSESSRSDKSVKENRLRDNHDLFKKDSHDVRNNHENKVSHEGRERYNNDRKEEKLKHFDRDEKRKENTKENRENNLHDKIANIASEIKENNKPSIESRHFSIDLDRNRIDSGRRKERNNSLPVSIGSKRRLSSQDSMEMLEEIKKIKLNQEHRKLSEKRESKDLKLDDKNKNKHKNNIAKIIEDKMRQEKLNSVKDNTDDSRKREKDKEEKHRHKQKMEKQKSKEKEKSKEKDVVNPNKPSLKELTVDKEFLGRIDLQSIEESEKLQRQRKEAKEKRKQESLEGEDRRSSEDQRKSDDKRKEKRPSIDSKSRDENSMSAKSDDRKFIKRDRIRKMPQNSSDAATDSDEPKKPSHSIFDIVDDEPAYISMYDKVKARSCKNMQKQEEEKRQEKLKAKFNQLKQSRAKREEKKRSTSCDEDSDSDQDRHDRTFSKIDINKRRSTKLLIMSSDDDEHGMNKHRKKRDIYTDSDSDKHHTKSEHMETSDEELAKIKNLVQRKCLKSRIGSDSSDDDYKSHKIKTELFSESEVDSSFGNMEYLKKIKEDEKYAKKEKRNKHHELSSEEMFRSSPLPEIKTEDNFDSERMFGDMSSAEDNHESKKQKNELRKKHKKKQKRQKHSTTSEDNKTSELLLPNETNRDDSMERLKNLEKKKQHSKKDKKRDKNKDDDKYRDKSRKSSKKSKSEMSKIDLKRDGKMENIFGSFSDDSETGMKEQQDKSDHVKASSFLISEFTNDKLSNYCSDSDSAMQVEKDIRKSEEKERLREEHKKRKERKRREKEKRIREEEFNENSVDYADLGKQLEANIKDDSNDNLDETGVSVKSEEDDKGEEVVKYAEDESQEVKSGHERKEVKEKRKKRKKSKEEKHKHHHHHHEKAKVKSPEIKKEFDLLPLEDVTEPSEKPMVSSPGLPNLNDMGSPILKSPRKEESLETSETTVKTPTTPKEKKREKLIPGFGVKIDEKLHETAIKSISEFDPVKLEVKEEIKEECKPIKPEVPEDKPRVIISQEETEDAVAALLGESFGENEYSSCYSDDQPTVVASEQEESISEENIVEDLEEMRQAVQSLNTGDLEIKPETPQSEHELQIDTDTDEPEDASLRFDQSPKTPERIDFSQPPKTPDIPSYYRPEEHAKSTVVIKATNLTSPPLLTPIKPLQPIPLPSEIKKVDTTLAKPVVTTQVWPIVETKPIDVVKKELVPEINCVPITTETVIAKSSPSPKPVYTNSVLNSSYIAPPPMMKISEVVQKVSEAKNTELLLSTTTHCVKPVPPQYNLTSHVKFNNSPLTKLPSTSTRASPVSPKVNPSSMSYNRLPITPIMMAKPFQATTTALPQPKLARANDINACLNQEYNKDQSRVSQYLVSSQTPTRMIVQNLQLQRAITPQTIVKHIPYGLQQSSYLNQTTPKENSVDPLRNSPDQSKLLPALYPYSLSPQIPTSVITDVKQPVIVKPEAPKPFMPVIQETPKLVSLSSTTPTSTIIQPTNKPLNLPPMQLISKVEVSCPPPNIVKEEETPVVPPKLEVKAAEATPEPQQQLAVAQVTEALNLFLKEEKQEIPDTKLESKVSEDIPKVETEKSELELETPTVIKTTAEKLDEDKVETESIESDVSKERLSADLVIKDDGLDSKEDSDYWSAKEVNIDSVIQKVDALCSADELSDRSSEIGKDDWYDHEIKSTDEIQQDTKPNLKIEVVTVDAGKEKESLEMEDDLEQSADEKEAGGRGGRRGGRNRGRKARGVVRGGVQTRNAKTVATPVSKRGGRGGRTKNDRKIPKMDSETADVYEFRDDADDNNKDRPRLILTIKSPVVPSTNNGNSPAVPLPIAKEVPKEVPPPKEVTATSPKVETKEEFISPTNTRKSRRLQERDISRNTIDDTIEDVVRNVAITTRSGATLAQNQLRRSTRQNAGKPPTELLQKSPRAGGRKKDRRASETTDDSSEEKSVKSEGSSAVCEVEKPADPVPPKETTENSAEVVELPKEKPHQTLKAAVLRRVKGELNSQEPMTLIDPVTGLLTEMRECEEGRYIPVGGGNYKQIPNVKLFNQINKQLPLNAQILIPPKQMEPIPPKSVIAVSPVVMAPQQKPHSLKAHVLSSQATRVVVSQPQPHQPPPQKFVSVPPPIVVTQPNLVMKTNIPINQHLNISVSSPNLPPMHLSPKPNSQPNLTKPLSMPPAMKLSPQPTQPSPNQLFAAHVKQQHQQQHIAHPMNKQQPQPAIHKTQFPLQSVSNIPPQVINAQVVHTKQLLKGQLNKSHGLHQPSQILTGAVASPPLKQAHHIKQPSMVGANSGRVIQGTASIPMAGAKNSMDPHKVDSCVMVPHPTSSPQGQPSRNILQSTLPMPAYEANMHGERSVYNRSRSPPPAHQNSPSPQGEALTHFPPGSVKLRPPHDILPAHYMPQHVMYQQYLRQPYHLPRSPLVSSNIEKSVDGQEGEEAPVELRRPGSVGLALTGRSLAVPHSLQSPHDRSTDSPQVSQVYNIHNSRLQHCYSGRYFDSTEPPPAHRPITSHGSYGERPLGQIGPLGNPERPMSNHLPPERPLSNHLPPERHHSAHLPPDRPISGHPTLPPNHMGNLGVQERSSAHLPDKPPLSAHGFALGAGLGAAGNLMGAVARHVGAEAPATQRGLQAATPPHASQVPPQAESLLMLLKQYPCMWQGLLALKNDQAAVQMYFVSGNDQVAKCSLPKNTDGSTPPLRIFQRMRLEPLQVEGVARKMQMENEHCMLLALPCGHDHMDVLKQSTNLTTGFITYLQQKQAAGIVNVAAPGTTQPAAYVVHIFPSCDFVNENLRRIAPNLLERVSDIAHLLIVITTVCDSTSTTTPPTVKHLK